MQHNRNLSMASVSARSLFGTANSLPPAFQEARAELIRLAEQRRELAGPSKVLSNILGCLYAERVHESPPLLTAPQAVAKLQGGLPLLRGEVVRIDDRAFRRRWLTICEAVQREHAGEASQRLAGALERGQLEAQQLTADLVMARPEAVHALAEALDLDPALTATILRLTLFPVFTQFNAALEPLRAGIPWEHGYCPTCGSWPLLGEFRGLEQTRYLRCGLCAAEWPFPRSQCPYCGPRDHREVGYFHVEGEETRYRAATCTACQGYVKMLSTLSAFSPPRLLVADLATMHLDLAAADRGYSVQP
jgi:FdhE protein